MAIDLPPQMPPQQVELQAVKASSPIASVPVGKYEVRVSGSDLLSAEDIKLVLGQASNPSQAVVMMGGAYHEAGHLLMQMTYALEGDVLHVRAMQSELAGIVSPPALEGFFDSLIGDADLTRAEFEKPWILADVKARRAGENVSISYRTDPDDLSKVTMVMTAEQDPKHDPTEVTLQVGNPGNRFLGRYFAQASVRHQTSFGTEVAAGWEKALTSIGRNPRGGKDYDRFQIVADHPTPYGLYGFDISHTDYTQEILNIDLDAEISEVGLVGRQILMSRDRSRLNVYQRLEHIESEIVAPGNLVVIDEPHTSFELGAIYHRLFTVGQKDVTTAFDLAVESGLSNDHGTLGTLPTPGVVAPGRRTAEFLLIKPTVGFSLPVLTSSTVGLDLLAQFSNDDQVPQQQQWVLGGMGSLSAYLPGTLVGDTGYFARLYLEGGLREFGFLKVIPSVFVEGGAAKFEDADGDAGDTRSIVDAGVKLASELGYGFSLELIAAVPLTDSNLDSDFLEENESDVFFRLRKVF